MKGGKLKMDRRIILWGVISVLFVVTLFLTFKAGSVVVVQTAGSVAQSVSAASSGMVGGC